MPANSLSASSCPATACGFKFKYPIQHQLFPEVVDELKSLGNDLRVIVLSRRNVLKQSISRQNMLRISEATGGERFNLDQLVDGQVKQQLKQEPIHLDVPAVVQYARQLEREKEGFFEVVDDFEAQCGAQLFRIDYEDLLADQATVIARILDFLTVPVDAPLFSLVEKATPDRLAAAIRNFEELQAAVAGTELEVFLSDDPSN